MKRSRGVVVGVLLVLAMVGCGGDDDAGPGAEATATLEIVAFAGPTCPVATDPPDPNCADRPVEGATVVVTDGSGAEVARGTTGADGTAVVQVPPGDLEVVPQAVEGILGTAPPVTVSVADGETLEVPLAYDTGIR